MANPDGSPAVGVAISFQLTDTFGNPTDAWDTSTGANINGTITTMTDNTGTFTVNLWPNDRGIEATRYLCKCAAQNINFLGFIPSGGGSLEFSIFYLGGQGSASSAQFTAGEIPDGLLNGSNLIYTLSETPLGGIAVFANANILFSGTDYTLSGNTLTLNISPLNSGSEYPDTLYVGPYAYTNGSAQFSGGEIPVGLMNGVNMVYTIAQVPLGGILAFANASPQFNETDYTLSGNTITRIGAPLNSANNDTFYVAPYAY